MSLIGQITFINQNSHIPSIVATETIAREHLSKEIKKIINEEKELKVQEIRPLEEAERILPEESRKRDVEREAKNHINLKG